MVTMKFKPVRIEENPVMKMPRAAGMTREVTNLVLSGAYIVQPVSTPPVTSAYKVKPPPSI
jgi:hypothetical protein